jgi:hypothetical protein
MRYYIECVTGSSLRDCIESFGIAESIRMLFLAMPPPAANSRIKWKGYRVLADVGSQETMYYSRVES